MKDLYKRILKRVQSDLRSDWINFKNHFKKRNIIIPNIKLTLLSFMKKANSYRNAINYKANKYGKFLFSRTKSKYKHLMAIAFIPLCFGIFLASWNSVSAQEQISVNTTEATSYTDSLQVVEDYNAEVARIAEEERIAEEKRLAEEQAKKAAEAQLAAEQEAKFNGEEVSCAKNKNVVYMPYDVYKSNGGDASYDSISNTGVAMHDGQYMVVMGSYYTPGESYLITLSNGNTYEVYNAATMTTSNGCTTNGSDAIVEILAMDNFVHASSGTAYAMGLSVSKITTLP